MELLKNAPKTAAVVVLVAATGLSACQTNKQTIGSVIGAGAGVAVGSTIGAGGGRTAAMIAGGVLGALIGSEIGRTMDENDRLRASQTTQYALERGVSGQSTEWVNPDTGYSGYTTPEPAYFNDDGQRCREYTQAIEVDGRRETATGVACRQDDGTWRILNS